MSTAASPLTTAQITQLIAQYAAQYGIPAQIALEVAMQESSLNQAAMGSSGEIGIFQLMPATAAGLGVDPTDPVQNVQGGCEYLAQLFAEFGGDWQKALAAYNWGPGNVSNAVSEYGSAWFSNAPSGVQNYVNTILANAGTQYTVSVTPAPASSPAAPASLTSTAVETAGLSTETVAWILGAMVAAGLLWSLLE
jgi:soluble lytic murein transglycosylase-like protein